MELKLVYGNMQENADDYRVLVYNKSQGEVKCDSGFDADYDLSNGEINEEKFINKALKKAKAGTAVTHTSFSIIKMSEAGGDCEHGSIFYTLFRSISNKMPRNIKRKESSGLTYFPFVDVAVLDENGNQLGVNKLGRIVANSPCTMKRYKNNEEATKKFFIKDTTGKEWADMNLYGYIDETKKVHIYGRILENELIHPSIICKQILKDTKNIMSCEVVKDNITGAYIAHVEMYPNARKGKMSTIYGANERCISLIKSLGITIYYKFVDNQESYPLTRSGKRDVKKIIEEGLTKDCFIPIHENGEYKAEYYSPITKALKKDKK